MNPPLAGPPGALPLAGLSVAVTRPATKGDRLTVALGRLGAAVIESPALRLVPPIDPEPLRRAAARVQEFDWVVVTSTAGVEALSAAVAQAGGGAPRRLAVVGSRTAAAAAAAGWQADLIPERFDAEGLLEQLDQSASPVAGMRVLLALAEGARDVLREGLVGRGANVDQVAAYGSAPPAPGEHEELAAALAAGRLDLVTLTSSSAAQNLLDALGPLVLNVPVAAVGPVTAGTALELGYQVVAVAEEHTMDGLVAAVTRWWAGR